MSERQGVQLLFESFSWSRVMTDVYLERICHRSSACWYVANLLCDADSNPNEINMIVSSWYDGVGASFCSHLFMSSRLLLPVLDHYIFGASEMNGQTTPSNTGVKHVIRFVSSFESHRDEIIRVQNARSGL